MSDSIIHNWLINETDVNVGLRLFLDYCNPDQNISRIISKNPNTHIQVIRLSLAKKIGVPYLNYTPSVLKEKPELPSEKKEIESIRTKWPFLAENTCPPELKLLISDKITAYRNCIVQYDKMTEVATNQEQLQAVSELVTSFIENNAIFQELKTYKQTGKVLGEHSIFVSFKRIKDLRNMSTIDLFKKKKNLEHAIWRNESKIKLEKREDLLFTRNEKIKDLKMQLAEVDRLLN